MLDELMRRYPALESVKDSIQAAYKILETCYEDGGKLLIAGNGGSAADSEHIVGARFRKSFRGGFRRLRCPVMPLCPLPLPTMWTGLFPMLSR